MQDGLPADQEETAEGQHLACRARQLKGNTAELPRLAFLVMLGEQQSPWRVMDLRGLGSSF